VDRAGWQAFCGSGAGTVAGGNVCPALGSWGFDWQSRAGGYTGGMRAIVTGQVGVDKGPYLEAVKKLAVEAGHDLEVFHVGKMMYEEAPDVPAGRILNLPIARLNTLRRAVFKEILRLSEKHQHVIVNTHATFRWRHGLFAAFDYDQIKQFNADLYVTLLDNAESVHQRLNKDHDIDHTLKDIMVWREEENLATEIIANILRGHGHSFILSRGRVVPTTKTLYRMMFEPKTKKVYPSFPMSHVMDLPETLKEINAFREVLAEHFIAFDPGDVDEFVLHMQATKAKDEGKDTVEVEAAEGKTTFKTDEVIQISGDIMGQIYARDFKMVDQSDMIVSLVPELPNGKPGLSSGVERELHHAWEGGKEVYVVWACRGTPSPFITETATRVFRSVTEAVEFFKSKGYIK
jgi:adenylate kinase